MTQPLKLIDFGCAFDMTECLNYKQTAAGTTVFMAPEVNVIRANCNWLFVKFCLKL